MASIYRFVLFAVAALLSLSAFADGGPFPATGSGYSSTNTPYVSSSEVFGSPSALCSTFVSRYQSNNSGRTLTINTCSYPDGWNASEYAGSSYLGEKYGSIQKKPGSCPDGATASTGSGGESLCTCTAGLRPSNGQCVAAPSCPDGQHEEGGACVPDNCKPNETRVNGVCVPEPPCPTGQTRVNGKCVPSKCPSQGTVSDQWYEVTSPGTSATCLYNSNDGSYCTMSVKPSVIASSGGTTTYMGGYGVYTGGTCGPSEPGKPTPQDPDKPDGDPDKGTKPPGPNDPRPDTKPGGQPGGPGNNPTPPGPDGKCPDGTYKSNGGCYQKDPPKQPPDADGKCPNGYIKVNSQCVPLMPPEDKDPNEKDPSSFGGQCDAITCDGDAIQCAIVREQYRRNCKLFDNDNDSGSLTNRALAGTDDDSAAGLKARAEKVAISSFDQNGFGWSRTCPPDPSFEVVGESFEIPFSKVCGVLGVLSSGALGLTLLSCLMWVVGRRD